MSEGFKPRNLSVLAYANGFTLWHYITPDIIEDVDREGYFEEARDMLRSGDAIYVNYGRDSTMKTAHRAVDASGSSGVVISKIG